MAEVAEIVRMVDDTGMLDKIGVDPVGISDVLDALDECAPEGCYFGPHEGDGSDFGFWPIERP